MILNSLLKVSNDTLAVYQFRNRATYYKQEKTWIPRFVRRFFIRYPKAPFHIAIGIAASVFFYPVIPWSYKYWTMSKEEFLEYRENFNKEVKKRQRYGIGLKFFPWKTEENNKEN